MKARQRLKQMNFWPRQRKRRGQVRVPEEEMAGDRAKEVVGTGQAAAVRAARRRVVRRRGVVEPEYRYRQQERVVVSERRAGVAVWVRVGAKQQRLR